MPTQDDENSSISLNLQKVFYYLQSEDREVSTRDLLLSFGWDLSDFNVQHDI